MATSLGGIDLPDDLPWTDEFEWEPVAQAAQRTLGGVQILEESELVAGRPITLGTGGEWISRATLLELRELASFAGETHVLILRGVEYDVVFRRPAIKATPVIGVADPIAADRYEFQLNLMTV